MTESSIPSGFHALADAVERYLPKPARGLLVPVTYVEAKDESKQPPKPEPEEPRPIEPESVPVGPLENARKVATPSSSKRMRSVQVFSDEALNRAREDLKELETDARERSKRLLDLAAANCGRRTLPDSKKAIRAMQALRVRFRNFGEVISKLITELILAEAMPCEDFRISPVLLVGDPGIGKTFFARAVAHALGSGFEMFSVSSAQGAFQLAGTSQHYATARQGVVLDALAKGKSASPLLLLDELDKAPPGDERFPILPSLLELLEPVSARTWRDEFHHSLTMDASKILVLLAANEWTPIPAPLISRCHVIEIPAPDIEHRLDILREQVSENSRKLRRRLYLDDARAQLLAERTDLDIREMLRVVKDGIAIALAGRRREVVLTMPSVKGRRAAGFGS